MISEMKQFNFSTEVDHHNNSSYITSLMDREYDDKTLSCGIVKEERRKPLEANFTTHFNENLNKKLKRASHLIKLHSLALKQLDLRNSVYLVGRENEVKLLQEKISNLLEKRRGGFIHITGLSGVGKTCVVNHVAKFFTNAEKYSSILEKSIHKIHCASCNNNLLENLSSSLGFCKNKLPKHNKKFSCPLTNFKSVISSLKKIRICIIEELDYLNTSGKTRSDMLRRKVNKRNDQVLALIEASCISASKVIVLAISNSIDLVQNLSKTNINDIIFPPYTESQLKNILSHKLKPLKNDLSSIFHDSSQELVYRRISNQSGDIRACLLSLSKAITNSLSLLNESMRNISNEKKSNNESKNKSFESEVEECKDLYKGEIEPNEFCFSQETVASISDINFLEPQLSQESCYPYLISHISEKHSSISNSKRKLDFIKSYEGLEFLDESEVSGTKRQFYTMLERKFASHENLYRESILSNNKNDENNNTNLDQDPNVLPNSMELLKDDEFSTFSPISIRDLSELTSFEKPYKLVLSEICQHCSMVKRIYLYSLFKIYSLKTAERDSSLHSAYSRVEIESQEIYNFCKALEIVRTCEAIKASVDHSSFQFAIEEFIDFRICRIIEEVVTNKYNRRKNKSHKELSFRNHHNQKLEILWQHSQVNFGILTIESSLKGLNIE